MLVDLIARNGKGSGKKQVYTRYISYQRNGCSQNILRKRSPRAPLIGQNHNRPVVGVWLKHAGYILPWLLQLGLAFTRFWPPLVRCLPMFAHTMFPFAELLNRTARWQHVESTVLITTTDTRHLVSKPAMDNRQPRPRQTPTRKTPMIPTTCGRVLLRRWIQKHAARAPTNPNALYMDGRMDVENRWTIIHTSSM